VGDTGEELDVMSEAQAIAASAAALVREFVEEDITGFESVALPPATEASTLPVKMPRKLGSAPIQAKESGSANPPLSPSSDVSTTNLPWADHKPTLAEVEQHLGDCTRCGLCETRTKIVFGHGHPDARLMFIGEGPGEQEDKTGLPFVGRAGDLLTNMIEKGLGIPRSDVYICNIVKCRPPRNRTPLAPEVSACRDFLDGQIRAIAPQVIVTLGKPAASLLLDREVAITRLRGTWQEYQGIPLMPTLHPAFILRQYTPENRRAVWEDLKAAHERSQA
jgi:uracil-DNA glycosylase